MFSTIIENIATADFVKQLKFLKCAKVVTLAFNTSLMTFYQNDPSITQIEPYLALLMSWVVFIHKKICIWFLTLSQF